MQATVQRLRQTLRLSFKSLAVVSSRVGEWARSRPAPQTENPPDGNYPSPQPVNNKQMTRSDRSMNSGHTSPTMQTVRMSELLMLGIPVLQFRSKRATDSTSTAMARRIKATLMPTCTSRKSDRRGQSSAYLKRLRKRYKLGEFSEGHRSGRRKKRDPRRSTTLKFFRKSEKIEDLPLQALNPGSLPGRVRPGPSSSTIQHSSTSASSI